jgi:transcriptional regulator with XRE-family HTH domain
MTRLEFVRRSRGWTQEELARFLHTGFTGSTISLMETGRLRPTERQAVRLRETFGIPAEELLAVVSEPPSCAPGPSSEVAR